MSLQLINHSSDLKRLRDEGFDIKVGPSRHLIVRDVPYLNNRGEVCRGILVSTLRVSDDITQTPDDHVVFFAGEFPHHANGMPIKEIQLQSVNELRDGVTVNFSFSAKPPGSPGYPDYYEKMTQYVRIISGPAESVDPSVTAKTFPEIETTEEESVFKYADTASSRAGIQNLNGRLGLGNVGIVGLGGTGSYVVDLVAKTPVERIHLFDGDDYLNHNAFRSPGAPSNEDLRRKPKKTDYFREIYSRMHRGIISHPYFINESNVDELRRMDFVFLCLDQGRAKSLIVERLLEWGVPFIDVGMGLSLADDSLVGVIRVTLVSEAKRDHLISRVSLGDSGGDNEYSRNIQIADLNCLNASLAVIRWKKMLGFYYDPENDHSSVYTIDGNSIINEDKP